MQRSLMNNLDAKIIDEQFGFNKVVFEKKILTHFNPNCSSMIFA
jgi:hypothetical protein